MKQLYCLLLLCVFIKTAHAQDTSFYFTTSDSVKLYVHTAGAGTPCLFVHGGPGLTSYIFEVTPAAKAMEQVRHMVYYDQRGSGRSASAANGDYSIKRMEQDIEELRNFLHIKQWDVIGHSFAGIIMTAYARDYQPNIRSLVYIHCTLNSVSSLQSHICHGTRLLKELGDYYQPDTSLSKFDQMMKVHEELDKKRIEYKIMFRSQRDKDIEDSLIEATTPSGSINQDFQHHVWKMEDYAIDYARYTPNITCPVLIITGTKDFAVGPDAYKSWHFRNKQVAVYNGSHTSYQEGPAWFEAKILPFLEKKNF